MTRFTSTASFSPFSLTRSRDNCATVVSSFTSKSFLASSSALVASSFACSSALVASSCFLLASSF
eukprot:CAMPEP_0173382642 /NCGR_PEP_ID=MMETSP1356-20130122/5171_1 /TAXON_ID=77927 ORGANISM="Hemiselmis virescens, Strain PCC157" /NCGR_SAMPLE_ID=MMETSP1356 /ASSEMBLY_ACC=CAM_ASM_000847 /LENGTH=64 /DNA_ID=CAMNT_0014337095 /DNA_START=164 /DNA_END=355 /DNA_ORIENTATION=+